MYHLKAVQIYPEKSPMLVGILSYFSFQRIKHVINIETSADKTRTCFGRQASKEFYLKNINRRRENEGMKYLTV